MSKTKESPSIQLDTKLLEVAEKMVVGQGDGRISKTDAERLFTMVENKDHLTDLESITLQHIRDYFKWTDAAATILDKKGIKSNITIDHPKSISKDDPDYQAMMQKLTRNYVELGIGAAGFPELVPIVDLMFDVFWPQKQISDYLDDIASWTKRYVKSAIINDSKEDLEKILYGPSDSLTFFLDMFKSSSEYEEQMLYLKKAETLMIVTHYKFTKNPLYVLTYYVQFCTFYVFVKKALAIITAKKDAINDPATFNKLGPDHYRKDYDKSVTELWLYMNPAIDEAIETRRGMIKDIKFKWTNEFAGWGYYYFKDEFDGKEYTRHFKNIINDKPQKKAKESLEKWQKVFIYDRGHELFAYWEKNCLSIARYWIEDIKGLAPATDISAFRWDHSLVLGFGDGDGRLVVLQNYGDDWKFRHVVVVPEGHHGITKITEFYGILAGADYNYLLFKDQDNHIWRAWGNKPGKFEGCIKMTGPGSYNKKSEGLLPAASNVTVCFDGSHGLLAFYINDDGNVIILNLPNDPDERNGYWNKKLTGKGSKNPEMVANTSCISGNPAGRKFIFTSKDFKDSTTLWLSDYEGNLNPVYTADKNNKIIPERFWLLGNNDKFIVFTSGHKIYYLFENNGWSVPVGILNSDFSDYSTCTAITGSPLDKLFVGWFLRQNQAVQHFDIALINSYNGKFELVSKKTFGDYDIDEQLGSLTNAIGYSESGPVVFFKSPNGSIYISPNAFDTHSPMTVKNIFKMKF